MKSFTMISFNGGFWQKGSHSDSEKTLMGQDLNLSQLVAWSLNILALMSYQDVL